MPKDSKGNFHMNAQRSMAAEKHGGSIGSAIKAKGSFPKPAADVDEMKPEQDAEPSQVPEHLAAMHEQMGGKMTHIHSPGDGTHTTHHVEEDGEVQGPTHHPDTESLKRHVGQVHGGEEEQEPSYTNWGS